MSVPWGSLFAAAVFSAAGFCLFLLTFNRVILGFKEGRLKDLVTGTAFLLLAVCPGLMGLVTGVTRWLALPAIFLGSVVAAEGIRMWARHRYRLLWPAETHNFNVSIAQPLTTSDLAMLRYEVVSERWTLPPLRVAHISDLHVGHQPTLGYYRAVEQLITRMSPDLLFITGDFATKGRAATMLPEVLRWVTARLGVFAVLGNHDYWAGAEEVAAAVRQAGVSVLQNDCQSLPFGDRALRLCGCDDPWGPSKWRPPSDPGHELTMVLSHTPDNIYKLSRAGAFAVFSGHCHGGQIRLPGFGSIVVPSVYGRRFDHGYFLVNGTHLFVTAGIGASPPSFRVYCQPDVFIVDFRGVDGAERR